MALLSTFTRLGEMKFLLLFFAFSAFISFFLTWCVRNFAVRRGIIPPPDAHHIHRQSIPRIGGIAVFIAFSSLVLLYALIFLPRLPHNEFAMDVVKLALTGSILFAVGLVDDLRGLRARIKLVFQIGGGVCLYYSGISFPALDLNIAGFPVGGILSFSLTIFWVVLICNGLNLIDGLDGLATGTAYLTCIPLMIVAIFTGRPVLSLAIIVFSGALLGFLVFNFNPASIFLGDSGSLFIGFLLSGFLLSELRAGQHSPISAVSLLCAFALPMTDTLLSVLRRLVRRRPLFSADREHLHHRLISIGFPHHKAVLILYGISTVAAGLSIFLIIASPLATAVALALCFLFTIEAFRKLRSMESAHTFELHRMSPDAVGRSTIPQELGGLVTSTHGFDAQPYFHFQDSRVGITKQLSGVHTSN
jgi:UDP-GlcNAc:undecaprenyl-phosphate GlcNAc-1-phosphate transferase